MKKNIFLIIVGFLVNTLIGFFLAPYIIRNIGLEAYGYVALGSQFVNYALIIGIALNSMSTRFISVEYHRKNFQKANEYFSSIVIFNLLVALVIIIPLILFIGFLQHIISISDALVLDVQILFILLFFNFLLGSVLGHFSISYYTHNTLYIKSAREIEAKVLYMLIIISLFYFFKPSLYFIGIATLISSVYNTLFGIYYSHRWSPEIKFKLALYKLKSLKEIFVSGVWNLITHLGQILMQGLDLIIVNVYLGATVMGQLALSKTIPLILITLVGTLANSYAPTFNKHVALNDHEGLKNSLIQSMKVLGLFTNVPIAIYFSFGEDFYRLWVPSEDAASLHYMSLLAFGAMIISGPVNTIFTYFSSANKLRFNSLLVIISGLFNILVVVLFIRIKFLNVFTLLSLGIFLTVIKNFFFTIPYASKLLNVRQLLINKVIFKSLLTFILTIGATFSLKRYVSIDGWADFIVYAGISGVFALVINLLLIFSKEEIYNLVLKKRIL